MDYRLTKPATPKTNGMVERVNGTIKNRTILKEKYLNKNKMISALNIFLFITCYTEDRVGLKRTKCKNSFNAIEKCLSRNLSVSGE